MFLRIFDRHIFHEMKVKTVSSHSLNIMSLIVISVITVSFCFVFLFPLIKKVSSKDAKSYSVYEIVFFTVYMFYIVKGYVFIFRNSVIKFSALKIKISPLLKSDVIIDIADVLSVVIKRYEGGECAVITYKHKEKLCKAYTHQHPFDNATNTLIGVQGLLESGSDWTHIYDLKKIVEQRDQQP